MTSPTEFPGWMGGGTASPGFPKRKSMEFDRLKFSYDYIKKEFAVDDLQGTSFVFGEAELAELRAAMATFGIINGIGTGQVERR